MKMYTDDYELMSFLANHSLRGQFSGQETVERLLIVMLIIYRFFGFLLKINSGHDSMDRERYC